MLAYMLEYLLFAVVLPGIHDDKVFPNQSSCVRHVIQIQTSKGVRLVASLKQARCLFLYLFW